MSHDNSVEGIKKEIKVYLLVFLGLGILTAVTVGVRYVELPVKWAVVVALTVASIKGFLVAGFFMHLLNEKRLIYSILILTVIFFAVLLWGPLGGEYGSIGS